MVIWKREEVETTPKLKEFVARLFNCLPLFKTLGVHSVREESSHQGTGLWDEFTRLIQQHGSFYFKREDFI